MADYQGPVPGGKGWNDLTKSQKNSYYSARESSDAKSPPSAKEKKFRETGPGTYEDASGNKFGLNSDSHRPLPEGSITVEPSDPKFYGR